jgi:hypothetical protein
VATRPISRNTLLLGGLDPGVPGPAGPPGPADPVIMPIMGAAQYPGLFTTRTATARCQPPDLATMPAGGSYTILDVAGAGYISQICFAAMKYPPPAVDTYHIDGCEKSRLRIYVDGEVTPSIDVAWVDLCCCRGAGGTMDHTTAGRESDRFGWAYFAGTGTSFYVNFAAPFSSHVKVVFVNGDAVNDILIAGAVNYHLGTGMNWGKYGKLHIDEIAAASIAPYTTHAMADVAAPHGGLLAGMYNQMIGGDGNLGYNEGYIDLYVDSPTTTNRYDSIEDYFMLGYYFEPGIQLTSQIGCTYYAPSAGGQGAYRFHDTNPVPFDSSLKITVMPGVAAVFPQTNPIQIRGCVWWYEATAAAASTLTLLKGDPGVSGSVIYSGAGAPSGGVGISGDYYIDTGTADVYNKTGAGWGAPILNIKGATGAPGASLATAYSVDFSALTASNLKTGGDGTKTLDGKPWALAQSVNAQTVWLNDGTHAGLYLRCSVANTDDYLTTYNGPRLIAGLTDLSGIRPAQTNELWVMVMFSQPHTPNANYEFVRMSVLQLPTNAADTAATYRRFSIARGYSTTLACAGGYRVAGTSTGQPVSAQLPDVGNDVYAFRILNNQRVEIYTGASVAGAFPAVSALTFFCAGSFLPSTPGFDALSINGTAANSFQWGLEVNVTTGNTAGNSDLLLKKLQVLYR